MSNNSLPPIYRVPKGEMVQLKANSGKTVTIDSCGNVRSPIPWGPNASYPVAITIVGSSFEKAVELVRGGLSKLPDLGHKFVLTWTPDYPFEQCCLVSTSGEDWWKKYNKVSVDDEPTKEE